MYTMALTTSPRVIPELSTTAEIITGQIHDIKRAAINCIAVPAG
jgi:hypothetical protein